MAFGASGDQQGNFVGHTVEGIPEFTAYVYLNGVYVGQIVDTGELTFLRRVKRSCAVNTGYKYLAQLYTPYAVEVADYSTDSEYDVTITVYEGKCITIAEVVQIAVDAGYVVSESVI